MAVLSICNAEGHSTLEYDTKNRDEVREARRTFDNATRRGYIGYINRVPTINFDEKAEVITMAPLVTGG